jgi:hypothetical protein
VKKRVRTAPSNPFYSNEPAVARGKITQAVNPSPKLSNATPKSVDKKPGRLSGLAGFADKKHPVAAKGNIPKISGVPGKTKFPVQGKKR